MRVSSWRLLCSFVLAVLSDALYATAHSGDAAHLLLYSVQAAGAVVCAYGGYDVHHHADPVSLGGRCSWRSDEFVYRVIAPSVTAYSLLALVAGPNEVGQKVLEVTTLWAGAAAVGYCLHALEGTHVQRQARTNSTNIQSESANVLEELAETTSDAPVMFAKAKRSEEAIESEDIPDMMDMNEESQFDILDHFSQCDKELWRQFCACAAYNESFFASMSHCLYDLPAEYVVKEPLINKVVRCSYLTNNRRYTGGFIQLRNKYVVWKSDRNSIAASADTYPGDICLKEVKKLLGLMRSNGAQNGNIQVMRT